MKRILISLAILATTLVPSVAHAQVNSSSNSEAACMINTQSNIEVIVIGPVAGEVCGRVLQAVPGSYPTTRGPDWLGCAERRFDNSGRLDYQLIVGLAFGTGHTAWNDPLCMRILNAL